MKIKQDKRNYRIHNDRNKDLIKKSLKECGSGRSILIDKNGEIIAGNGVFEQAEKLGIPVQVVKTDGKTLIAVQRTDLGTEDEKRKQLAVMDNSTGDASMFDIELMKEDFSTEMLTDFGLPVMDGSQIDTSSFFTDEGANGSAASEPKTMKCPHCGEIIEL